jgi:hypothetical protein
MFSKLREILLTQYIGSILVALLVWQAAVAVVTEVVRTGFWFANHLHNDSVFGSSSASSYPWDNFVFSTVTVALYLLTAYALARWLYSAPITKTETDGKSSSDQSEPS